MGQKTSCLVGRFDEKTHLPFSWMSRRQTCNPNPEQPIKFQFRTRRRQEPDKNRNTNNIKTCNRAKNVNNLSKIDQNSKNSLKTNDVKCRIVKTQNALRAKSEPNLSCERSRERHRHRRKSAKIRNEWNGGVGQFGYEIQDVDAFLTKATIEKPANIPVVLAFPSVLYQTRIGGYQAEISLPLGMVVNAVFKNQHWLYVQTPHAEEGYVSYAACLPLGIIPPPDDDIPAPCWEKSTDVFPKPSGNMTDTEKLSSKSECSGDVRHTSRSRRTISTCGEGSVDTLYLRAASSKRNRGVRQTLLVINGDYFGSQDNILHVKKGDVVVLLNTHAKGWFWVKNSKGEEGFIPAIVAGHGFL